MTISKAKLSELQVDLLLLSIIRAYDHPKGKNEMGRLADARTALFGAKRSQGRKDAFDYLALFKILDDNRKRELDSLRRSIAKRDDNLRRPEWQAAIENNPKPIRTAAREYLRFAGSSASDKSLEDRLRRKARTPLSTREMAKLEPFFDLDAPQTKTLVTILELLEKMGVQSKGFWDENP
ncbi:hypothetical protein [Ruegeria sp. HKCCD8929]|uniref:hypothetical protein n=1 Tax=Ruegeria sp. HKCCD8929 TaxID=2683006 RepID=UPI0014894E27|nr:hypothetical protein [Ruegeria sp. HKCCD8929]